MSNSPDNDLEDSIMNQYENEDEEQEEEGEMDLDMKSLYKKRSASVTHLQTAAPSSTSLEDIEAGLLYLRRLNEYYDAISMQSVI